MKKFLFLLITSASVLFSGCGDSFYQAQNYFTGPVDGVGIKKTTSIVEGSSEQLFPVVTPSKTSNKEVVWSSSDSAVASVDSTGVVSGITPGSTIITVTTADGGFTDTCDVTVTVKPVSVTGVTINKGTSWILTGGTEQLSAEISPVNATNQNLTWASEDAAIVYVDASGLVTARTAGSTTITVTANDGNFKANCLFTVSDSPVPITGIAQNKQVTVIERGRSERLYTSITPLNATNQNIKWSSSNTGIATVNVFGTVTGVSEGTARITAESIDGGFTAYCDCVIVAESVSVSGVSIVETSVVIAAGFSEQLTALIAPSNASNQNVTWSSSNSSIASVDSSGKVTGIAEGSAVITVTTSDGSKQASCNCLISSIITEVESVSLNKTSTTIEKDRAEQLFASVAPDLASDKSVIWTSSNSSIAAVNGSGVVTGKGLGSATITVTSVNGSKTDACLCTVATEAVIVQSITIPETLTLYAETSSPLPVTFTPSGATNQNVTWASSNSSIASVNSSGVVTSGATAGTAIITATSVDGSKMDSCLVTVKIPLVSINLVPSTSTITSISGTSTITVVYNPAGASDQGVTYKSLNPGIASVNASGVVTAISPGTATITAVSNVGNKSAECMITVKGYTLKYNANGGVGDVPPSAQYGLGVEVLLPGNTGSLVKPGLVFAGWGVASNSGVITTYTMIDANTTLYAQWEYELRSTGPGGGLIFYDKGYYSDGWRYMEAAPEDLGSKMTWASTYLNTGYDPGGGPRSTANVGDGYSNTNNVIALYAAESKTATAAEACRNYSNNIYSDWFLPSQGELQLMHVNLYQQGVGSFKTGGSNYYWSSTQKQNAYWYQYSMNWDFTYNQSFGMANCDSQYNSNWVRPVRRF